MKWFANIPTRRKLVMGFGLVLICFGIVVAIAFRVVSQVAESEKVLCDKDFALTVRLAELSDIENRVQSDLLMTMTLQKHFDREAWEQDIGSKAGEIERLLADLLSLAQGDQDFLPKLEEIQTLRTAYAQTRDGEVIPLLEAGKVDEAEQLVHGIQDKRFQRMQSLTAALEIGSQERAQAAVARSEQGAAAAVRIFVLAGILVLLLGVAMVLVLDRMISGPLRELSRVAESITSGDMTVEIPAVERADEVGVLIATLRRMVQRLRNLNQEIRAGIDVVASSATEILATTGQIASGAAETATAVSQTTTTVEEVKQTAQLSSQKAKFVADAAQKTVQVSQSGRRSVEETVEGMSRIREQVELVAESIVRLSEQGQAIGEIIASVNDLADQSNLLAVNAAIEAAKAGEQGRGFAVVAQEVRSLAEQSKQATAQVRSILGEIQKATSGAVMAIEQGNKAVENGAKQSMQAGDAVQRLAESIAEAAQAAMQIAASAQQQLVGMDQVATAMENIKRTSNQNAASSKQAEDSARNLHALGRKLQGVVEQLTV